MKAGERVRLPRWRDRIRIYRDRQGAMFMEDPDKKSGIHKWPWRVDDGCADLLADDWEAV